MKPEASSNLLLYGQKYLRISAIITSFSGSSACLLSKGLQGVVQITQVILSKKSHSFSVINIDFNDACNLLCIECVIRAIISSYYFT